MRIVALSLLLLLGAVCSPALAQTEPLEEGQKAVLAFDIRMGNIVDSELGKTLGLSDKLSGVQAQSGDEDAPDPANLNRVFGAMSAPADMATAMTVQTGEMPFEFFVQMQFKDAESVNKLLAKAKEKNSGTVESNGKTYYKSDPESGTPAGLLMGKVDEKTVEMGTEAYLLQANRRPFTDNLASALAKAPKEDAVRIVVDLEGAKGLIAEAVAMGKQQAPDPMVGVYMDLIDNMKNLRLSMDLAGENLLTIQATGVNEDDAVELKEGLDSLLGMAKMGLKAQLPMIREQDEDGAALAEQFAKSLTAKNSGEEVSVIIPKPEGFDEWAASAVNQLGALMGGAIPNQE
jgi:hypothetical protein